MPPADAAFGVASTYFELAGWLANNYYDPEYVPVLQGASDDGGWVWTKPRADTMRFYYRQDRQKVLQIATVMPQRYLYLSDWGKGMALLVLVLALLYGLYKLIRRVTAGIFLQKFVAQPVEEGLPYFEDCDQEMCDEITKRYQPRGDDAALDAMELEVLHCMRRRGSYFALVLGKCNGKEKYLLYQFACNGFLNYKNVVEIDHLIQRGILVVENEEVRLFSRAFRAYLLAELEERELAKSIIERSPWQRFRAPFLVLLMVAAAFLFFTRQEAWQRVSALIAALSSSLGLLGGLFREGMGQNDESPQ
jgi:hypothetical protein